MGRLDNKVALVTGSARGIGLAIARAFAKEGALVGVCDLAEDAAREAAKGLKEVGREGVAFAMDVTNPESVDKGISGFIEGQGGRLDILVNNAGITKDGLLMRMSDAQWDLVLKVNLNGVFYCTRAAIRTMIKQRSGRIINMASVVGLMGNPGQANYAASKGGVIALTKTTAKEVASRNITVNAIAPGFIKTFLTDQMTDKAKAAIMGQIPMERLGIPEDVAGVALFLASAEASYVTGQVIPVDGGMVM